MTDKKMDMDSLRALHKQIEDICRHFKEIRQEAAGIVETSQMPDAALHLNDVLESTEQATTTILDAAIAIDGLSANLPADIKEQITSQVARIYEASSFQDISGQRIKKVLRHLNDLETQLTRLSEAARGQVKIPDSADHLLNGPALASEAPSQEEIDRMFKQM